MKKSEVFVLVFHCHAHVWAELLWQFPPPILDLSAPRKQPKNPILHPLIQSSRPHLTLGFLLLQTALKKTK